MLRVPRTPQGRAPPHRWRPFVKVSRPDSCTFATRLPTGRYLKEHNHDLFDLTKFATWIPIVAGTVIPFVVAWLTRPGTSGNVKSVFAALGAALTALGMYLGDAGVHSWKGAASAFILALLLAATTRKTLTDHLVAKVQEKPSGIVGPTNDGP